MSNSAERRTRQESGFEQHSLAQLRRLALLSLAEKLNWLESAQQLAAQLQRQPTARRER